MTQVWISALGFICYIISFLLYTRIVMMFQNLSYITPICTGIVQILVLIASKLVLIRWRKTGNANVLISSYDTFIYEAWPVDCFT